MRKQKGKYVMQHQKVTLSKQYKFFIKYEKTSNNIDIATSYND